MSLAHDSLAARGFCARWFSSLVQPVESITARTLTAPRVFYALTYHNYMVVSRALPTRRWKRSAISRLRSQGLNIRSVEHCTCLPDPRFKHSLDMFFGL